MSSLNTDAPTVCRRCEDRRCPRAGTSDSHVHPSGNPSSPMAASDTVGLWRVRRFLRSPGSVQPLRTERKQARNRPRYSRRKRLLLTNRMA